MDKSVGRKRPILRLVLAGVAVLGIGAAITTAAWTDDVFFGATATASSFDLQGRDPAGTWQDVGLPGTTSAAAPIVLTAAALADLSPGEIINVPFQLCNVGTAAGSVTAVTTPTLTGPLFVTAGDTLTATVTPSIVGAALPSDPGCATPAVGILRVETTAAFPPAAQGQTGQIAFTVTGTSN